MSREALEHCATPSCRRRDVVVILRGPRGGAVPVCSVCWSRCPESGDTAEACAKVDAWYARVGAKPPERRGWPPGAAACEREAMQQPARAG